MKYLFGTIFSLFLVFSFTVYVNAQNLPPGIREDLIITSTPEIPEPGEVVTLKLESFSRDLTNSVITWTLDGITQSQGLGESTYTFVAPPSGTETIINIYITTEDRDDLEETLFFSPAEVDIVFEAQTYTPPFYSGKSMFSHQSKVRIAAIPNITENGVNYDSSDIFYTWEKNHSVMQDLSGRGKDTIELNGSIVSDSFFVTVTARPVNSDLIARRTIRIQPNNTNVIAYENDPLNGSVFENALIGVNSLEKEEIGVTAIPYFFSVNSRNDGSLKYSWGENSRELEHPAVSSDVLFTNEGLQLSGRSNIFVGVSHIDNILQSAKINFGLDVVGSNPLGSVNDETIVF